MLNDIKQAEAQAAKVIADAKDAARETLETARAEAMAIATRAEADTKQERETMVAAAEKDAAKEAEAYTAKMHKEIEHDFANCDADVVKAARALVEEITS